MDASEPLVMLAVWLLSFLLLPDVYASRPPLLSEFSPNTLRLVLFMTRQFIFCVPVLSIVLLGEWP
jgi:hypothetical protein